MTRQVANRMIVEAIKDAIELYPDWRFHQILQNMGIEQPAIDQWFEESDETLNNIKEGSNI